MRDLISDYERLAATGAPVGRAVVTSVWGSAPRPEGSSLLATPDGQLAGSVSGGCVETAAAQEVGDAIARGMPKVVSFGVSHERAWEVGLACGGTVRVLVEPRVRPELLRVARGVAGAVLVTVLDGPALGAALLVREDGEVEGPFAPAGAVGATAEATSTLQRLRDQIRDAALAALRGQLSRTAELDTGTGSVPVFLEVFPRQPTLVIFGGVHIAQALVPLARQLGYRTVVADGRQSFLSRERFPDADELVLDWPEAAFAQVGIGPATYVCILSHDPKFDDPALEIALRSPAAYIGAIGSKKTQTERRERLRAAGFSDADIARVRGPIGLDLGGRSPSETALAILAEMTAVRYGREGRALTPPGQPDPDAASTTPGRTGRSG
jgi:xanthine dehydrogenase accessory factor